MLLTSNDLTICTERQCDIVDFIIVVTQWSEKFVLNLFLLYCLLTFVMET